LTETGTESDLAAIVAELTSTWGLAPEPRSKFERALEMVRQRGEAAQRLSPKERAALNALSQDSNLLVARRASVILSWDQALPTREITARSGMSGGRVRYWVRTFRSQRMAIFAQPTAGEATEEPSTEPLDFNPQSTIPYGHDVRNPQSAIGNYEDIPGFCKSATTADIAANGYILTPGRYVGAEDVADDGEEFEEKMLALTATLHEQTEQARALDAAIWQNLERLGYHT